MKRHVLIGMLFSILALILVGCLSTDGSAKRDGSITLREKEVSFESEAGSLIVQNNTFAELVIFAGDISKNAILGGIKAGATRTFNLKKLHGIRNNGDNGSLLIRPATFDTYEKNSAKITRDDVIYTGLVTYDFKDPRDITQVNIYKGIDTTRKNCVYLTNRSDRFVLEVRLGSSTGQTIATLAPNERLKPVFLTPLSTKIAYSFYPQFVYVDPKTNEKTPFNVPGKKDCLTMFPYEYDPSGTKNVFETPFDEPENNSNISYSIAFLTIQNDTKAGLEFCNSRLILPNQQGIRFTPPGGSDVYELDTGNSNEGKTYTSLTCTFNQNTEKRISDYKFKPGVMYNMIWTDKNGGYQYDIQEVGKKSLADDARIELFGEEY